MRVIVLPMDDTIRTRFQEMMQHAKEHVVTLEELKKVAETGKHPIGTDPAFVCDLYANCKIVYSHEIQTEPLNECKHISISFQTEADLVVLETGEEVKVDTLPPPELVQMIMLEFGFKIPLQHSMVWKEQAGPQIDAVNIIEPVDLDTLIKYNEQKIEELKSKETEDNRIQIDEIKIGDLKSPEELNGD